MNDSINEDISMLARVFYFALSVPLFLLGFLVIFFGCKSFFDAVVLLPRSIVHFNQGNIAALGGTSGGFLFGPLIVYLGTRVWKFAKNLLKKSFATAMPDDDEK